MVLQKTVFLTSHVRLCCPRKQAQKLHGKASEILPWIVQHGLLTISQLLPFQLGCQEHHLVKQRTMTAYCCGYRISAQLLGQIALACSSSYQQHSRTSMAGKLPSLHHPEHRTVKLFDLLWIWSCFTQHPCQLVGHTMCWQLRFVTLLPSMAPWQRLSIFILKPKSMGESGFLQRLALQILCL